MASTLHEFAMRSMTWRARAVSMSPHLRGGELLGGAALLRLQQVALQHQARLAALRIRGVAAQVEIESKIRKCFIILYE